MDKLSDLVVGYKWFTLTVILLITSFFVHQLARLEVDSNVVNALPDTDPAVRLFKEVGETFGSNQIGLVIIEDDNVFDAASLDNVVRITDTLSQMDGVLAVRSITNTTTFQSEGDEFEIDDLIGSDRWPQNEEESRALRDDVTQNDLVKGTLVAEDGTSTTILFYFSNEADVKSVATAVVDKITSMDIAENVYFAGSTFLASYAADLIRTDMIRLIPIAFAVIAAILLLSFRSAGGVFLPLLSAALAIVWAMGSFSLLGLKLSMVSNNVPIIILAVGSAYTIHVYNRIVLARGGDNTRFIQTALGYVALPVILSGLTTVVGFTSFVFGAYLSMIRDFGILAALGTLYSMILALVMVPAIVAILPAAKKQQSEPGAKGKDAVLNRVFLRPFYHLSTQHPKRVIIVWSVLAAIGVAGIVNVERSVSVSDYFKSNHPASKADAIMEAKYGGSKPVYAVFRGDIQSPEVLSAMDDFSHYLEASPYISGTQSIADVVIKLNNALSETKGVPEDKASIQQLWFFLGQQDLSQLITEDLDQAVIMAKFNNEGQSNVSDFDNYVNDYIANNPSDDYTVEVTGMPYVNQRMDRSLVRSQLTSLLLAVILVIILVSLIFRSLLEGLYASTPIIATICILYGMMGFTGIPLNVATVLVASVAMGIGIDYSIHYISSFNKALRQSHNINLSVDDAIMGSGKAIFINFISVACGFLVLIFSDLMPMVYFGILIALSMLGSAMGALTLLPAVIVLHNRRKQRLDV